MSTQPEPDHVVISRYEQASVFRRCIKLDCTENIDSLLARTSRELVY